MEIRFSNVSVQYVIELKLRVLNKMEANNEKISKNGHFICFTVVYDIEIDLNLYMRCKI